MRQQRRKNAPTAQTSFPAFPQLYDNWIVTASGANTALLVSAYPLATPGIPALILNDVDLPTSITRPNDNEVEFTYPNPLGIDAVLRLAAWDANIRGFNGEWLAPKASTVNSSVPTTQVIWMASAQQTGANVIVCTYSENVTRLSIPNYVTQIGGQTAVSSVSGPGANDITVTFDAPVSGGADFIVIPQGDVSCQGVSGFFPAPAVVFFL